MHIVILLTMGFYVTIFLVSNTKVTVSIGLNKLRIGLRRGLNPQPLDRGATALPWL